MRGPSACSTALLLVSSSFLLSASSSAEEIGGSGEGLAVDSGDVSSSELDVVSAIADGCVVLSPAACLVSIAWLSATARRVCASDSGQRDVPNLCPVSRFVGARLLELNLMQGRTLCKAGN